MSDRELLDALSVLARRMGLIERGQRIAVVGDPRADIVAGTLDVPLCLAYGKYRDVRLCCTYAAGHEGVTGVVVHSWQNAMIGKSACTATSNFATTPDVTVHQCQRPTHHAGEHKATGADGVRWTWGDAPVPAVNAVDWDTVTLTTDSPEIRCKSRVTHPNGAYFVCQLVKGHGGDHRHQVTGGEETTWPDVICAKYGEATRVIDPTPPRVRE